MSLVEATRSFARHCRDCGHLLRGAVSRRCPECGRPFDPEDARTTSAHPFSEWRVSLASLARLMTWVAAVVAGAIFVCSALGFGFDLRWLFVLVLPLAPALLLTLILIALPV